MREISEFTDDTELFWYSNVALVAGSSRRTSQNCMGKSVTNKL